MFETICLDIVSGAVAVVMLALAAWVVKEIVSDFRED